MYNVTFNILIFRFQKSLDENNILCLTINTYNRLYCVTKINTTTTVKQTHL